MLKNFKDFFFNHPQSMGGGIREIMYGLLLVFRLVFPNKTACFLLPPPHPNVDPLYLQPSLHVVRVPQIVRD